jgi:hypothetical protein
MYIVRAVLRKVTRAVLVFGRRETVLRNVFGYFQHQTTGGFELFLTSGGTATSGIGP